MELITQYNPNPEEVSDIRARLFRHNSHIIPGYGYESVTIKTRTDKNNLAGALLGEIGGDWFCIDGLWVRESFRFKGIGSALLGKAEQIAIDKKCAGLYLYTYSFQAPEFYKKAGYRIFGRLEGFCGSHAKLFMKKSLV